jgi:hypothetical protein
MTWIYDGDKPRIWVEIPLPKRRKSPRALRFANLAVGDQLIKEWTSKGWRGGIDDMNKPAIELSKNIWYYLVTDLWFDPVAGQDNDVAGRMVAIVHIDHHGFPHSRKEQHTLRGLASEGFHYADRDFIAFCRNRTEAMQNGTIVGIGMGSVIRKRPKQPGFPRL